MEEDPLFEPVLRTESLYKGSYLNVESLTVRLPDNREARREVVRVKDAVAVLPIEKDETVRLVRQNRPAVGAILYEIPAGLVDPGESLVEAAVRECEEEIGVRPGKLSRLLTYAHAEGYSTGMITLFVGTELTPAGPAEMDATEYLERIQMPFQTLFDMVRKNEIKDSKTIISVLLWNDKNLLTSVNRGVDF